MADRWLRLQKSPYSASRGDDRVTRRSRFRGLTALVAAAVILGPVAFGAKSECDAAWVDREMRRRGVDPATFPNPLVVSSDMASIARSVVGPGSGSGSGSRSRSGADRVRRLQRYLFERMDFTVSVDPRVTATALETFDARRGNCVSFTTMLIALACSAGIPLQPALKTVGDAEKEGDLVLISDHVVAIHVKSPEATVFDFNVRRTDEWVGLRLISNLSLVAIHLNNLGVTAMLDRDAATATRYFAAAIRLAPDISEAHGNLGVVLRRTGDDAGALAAYRRGLELDAASPTILHNLAALWESTGRHEQARAALQAARTGELNPYTLIVFGDLELAAGRVRRALRLFRRAERKGRFIPEPYVAIARAELQRARPKAARTALQKALALDPDHTPATRLLATID